MNKPYYQEDGITIYQGDCLEILPELPKLDLVLTDPPYGINIDTSWLTSLNMKRGKPANKSDDKIIGDDGLMDLSFLFNYDKYLIFGFPYIQNDLKGWLVWDKQPGLDSDRTLGNPVEMASTNLWNGFRIVRCMWSGYYRDGGEIRYKHPTQKPLKVIKYILINNPEMNTILDPFLGSGTTAVACKQLGRKCIGIEIEEKYCEIAVKRLAQKELF